MNLDFELLYKVIYKMAERSNTILPYCVYNKLKNYKNISNYILKNAYLSSKNLRPLCQDTGQVVIYLKIGQNVRFNDDDFIYDVINRAVSDCYKDKNYRKSIVFDAINRKNTNTNTPSIIHLDFTKGNDVEIILTIKGGGCENTSKIKMMNPTSSVDDILDFAKDVVIESSENCCPPMSIGIGVGGTIEYSAYLSKLALIEGNEVNLDIDNVFDVKILTSSTHIANMPVSVSTSCHSLRYDKCVLKFENGKYVPYFEDKNYKIDDVDVKNNFKKVKTDEVDKILSIKSNENILLTGTIYTARDMAHQRLFDMIKNNEKLPFNLKNSIIFYAGPCPSSSSEIIGPIGPTTSKRMDNFAKILYGKGVLATIGKGNRSFKDDRYFKMMGGVANYMKSCVKRSEIVAFDDLGAEAIYKLEVIDLPIFKS